MSDNSGATNFMTATQELPLKVWYPTAGCAEDQLREPLSWPRPCKVFVPCDPFHEDITTSFADKVFAIIGLCFVLDKDHVFNVTTDFDERLTAYITDPDTPWRVAAQMKKLGPKDGLPGENSPPTWPLPNAWLGVSYWRQML